jgi:hypothetical protein
LSNVSDGWCSWQKLLDNTDMTIKTIITDLSKTTVAPVNYGEEARVGITGTLPLTNGGTGMKVSSIPQLISSLNIFPIGSIYTTSTNVNPGESLGGTWELFKKHFSSLNVKQTINMTNKIVTFNTTNVTENGHTEIHRSGDIIFFHLDVVHNAAWADSDIDIGIIDLSKIGISKFPCSSYELAIGDGANNGAMVEILEDGHIVSKDTMPDVLKVGTDYNITANYHWIIPDEDKLDEACDEFVWKRVS